MKPACALLLLLAAAAGVPARAADPEPAGRLERAATVDAGFPVAAWRLADTDGDGTEDLLLVGREGEVRVWHRRAEGNAGSAGLAGPFGDLKLPSPARSLLWLGEVAGDGGRPELAVLSPVGLTLYAAGEDGGFSGEGTKVARVPGFRLRVGRPVFSEILRDVNGDGRPDLLVPGTGAVRGVTEAESWCQIWVRAEGEEPAFRRTATVNAVLRDSREVSGRAVSDRYESSFRVPPLDFVDVNGDGRLDLIVTNGDRRLFHLQKEDGSIPSAPDVELDLDRFRDTTAEATIRPGRVLAGGDDAQLTMTDLDADGIPDYLIAHRRKIWIFKGTRGGPEFDRTPDSILQVSEDISALLVLPLDEDGRPDLLLLRVMIPSVASIVSGLLSELEVEISASGYAGIPEGRTFSPKPVWKGALTVVLPDVIGILRDPGALFGKFEETVSGFRRAVRGDFDGDGVPDLAMLDEGETRVDLWLLAPGGPGEADASGLGGLFFGGGDRRWDVDQVLTWLGDRARERAKRLTGGRPPAASFPLRDAGRYRLAGLAAARVAGGAGEDLLLLYREDSGAEGGLVDVYRFSGGSRGERPPK